METPVALPALARRSNRSAILIAIKEVVGENLPDKNKIVSAGQHIAFLAVLMAIAGGGSVGFGALIHFAPGVVAVGIGIGLLILLGFGVKKLIAACWSGFKAVRQRADEIVRRGF